MSDVRLHAVAHSGLSATVDGRPALLAVVDQQGLVVASGDAVAQQAFAVSVAAHRNYLKGEGWLKELAEVSV